MGLSNSRHPMTSKCFKSISVGTGISGAGAGFLPSDRHLDENMMHIPEYDTGDLPTVSGLEKNSLGCYLTVGGASLVLYNHKDGAWYYVDLTAV